MSGAIPAPDIFADNPTRHEELDHSVNREMNAYPNGPQDIMGYCVLLQHIIVYSDNQLDNVYSKASIARMKFEEDPNLANQLRDAWKSKSYRQIRNMGESYSRPSTTQT